MPPVCYFFRKPMRLPIYFYAGTSYLQRIYYGMEEEAGKIRELQQRIALYEDMKAYRLLYEMLFKGMHSFSYAFVKSSEAAEEIVSDVFIKLWQIRNELMAIDNLKVYLFIIAKHFSLNYITKHHKNPIVSLDEMEADTLIELGDPEEICISADTMENIREAVRQLPPQCRLIFQLVKEEGLPANDLHGVELAAYILGGDAASGAVDGADEEAGAVPAKHFLHVEVEAEVEVVGVI